MNTILRLLKGEHAGYHDLGIKNLSPQKGDSTVFKGQQYVVSYLEYDFDTDTVYIVCY